jgi:hypothetical protein
MSFLVAAFSSLHVVPLALLVTAQPPEPSQTEVCWHAVGAQTYSIPAHSPLEQTSLVVHPFPSLQDVPFGKYCPKIMLQQGPEEHCKHVNDTATVCGLFVAPEADIVMLPL